MSRLIDADDLKNVFEGYSCTENPNPHFPLDMVKKDIDKAPPVEAVPVVHGEWIGGKWYKECSVCSEVFTPTTTLPNFCPKCGADMRKKV